MSRQSIIFLSIIVCILQIGSILLGVRTYLSYTNTLKQNSRWEVTKSTLSHPGFDGFSFTEFPPAVAQEALDPSAWRGYHEVTLKEAKPWHTLSLRVKPTNQAYLYIIFNKTPDTFQAIRLSRSSLYRSSFITARYTGEFLNQTDIPNAFFDDSQEWQNVSLVRDTNDGNFIQLFINKNFVVKLYAPEVTWGTIGFRTGQKPFLVDDVVLSNAHGKIVFAEHFDNYQSLWEKTGIVFALWLVIVGSLLVATRNKPHLLLQFLKISFVVFITVDLILVSALLFKKQVRFRYPNFGHWVYQIGTKKAADGSNYAQEKTDWLLNDFAPKDNSNTTKRIMMIGSSQVEGEGKALPEEGVTDIFQKLLDEKLNTNNKKYLVIPAAMSGSNAPDLVGHFRGQWHKLKPDMVVVNLSSNDTQHHDSETFKQALEEFVTLSQRYSFVLVFSAEPNAIESRPYLENHTVMREVAEKHNLQFIDTHRYMSEQNDTGIIWWDFVHMTSHGYRLMANHLFTSLETAIKKL